MRSGEREGGGAGRLGRKSIYRFTTRSPLHVSPPTTPTLSPENISFPPISTRLNRRKEGRNNDNSHGTCETCFLYFEASWPTYELENSITTFVIFAVIIIILFFVTSWKKRRWKVTEKDKQSREKGGGGEEERKWWPLWMRPSYSLDVQGRPYPPVCHILWYELTRMWQRVRLWWVLTTFIWDAVFVTRLVWDRRTLYKNKEINNSEETN